MIRSGIKVFAPATVSNVGVGYNILGFALDKPGDEVLIRDGLQKGLFISKITGAGGKLNTDINLNAAGIAAQKLLEHIGETARPLEIEIHKKTPNGCGLGSAAASAVAGVFAVNEFLKTGFTKSEILTFAMEAIRKTTGTHLANTVAPSLLGGMILMYDHENLNYKKLYLPSGLFVVMIIQEIPIQFKPRQIELDKKIDFKDVIIQQAKLAAFISAMYTSDMSLLARCFNDIILEPQLAINIPYFNTLKEMAINEDAVGFGISGRGPALFALCDNSLKAETILEKSNKLFADQKVKATTWISRINQEGAVLF
jgi:homoserine kinase